MIYREEKKKGYTVISNLYLKDMSLSLKAKGLLTLMLSLPDNWIYSTYGLSMITKESKNTIHSILHELEKEHYLKRRKIRNEEGKIIYWNYDIYEKPYLKKQEMDYQNLEKQDIDFLSQLNIKKERNNNLDKLDKTKLNSLTLELVRKHFVNEDSLDILRYNDFFNEIIGQYEYSTILIVINYVVSRMKDKTIDEEGNPILQTFSYFKTSIINNLRKITDDSELFDEDNS